MNYQQAELLRCKHELEKALEPIFKNQMLLQEYKQELRYASESLFMCIDTIVKENQNESTNSK